MLSDAGAFRAEIVRILTLADSEQAQHRALGGELEARVAAQFQGLWEPGGSVVVAERGRRLEGVVQLVPDLMASAFLDRYAWRVRCLATLSADQEALTWALMEAGLASLEPGADFVAAEVAACDSETIRGLELTGFHGACGSVLIVTEPNRVKASHPLCIRIEPHMPVGLEALNAVAGSGGCYSQFAWDTHVDSDRLRRFKERKLLAALKEPGVEVLAARDGQGQVVGIALARMAEGEGAVGSVDFVGVRPDRRGLGIAEALHRTAVESLGRRGARTVTTQPMVKDEASVHHTRTLHRIGYRLVATKLVMHRWQQPSQLSDEQTAVRSIPQRARGRHGKHGVHRRV